MRFLTAFRAAAFFLTVTQLPYPVAAQDNKLAPPTRLWAAQTDPNTITLVWQGVPDAMEYLLFGPKSKKGEAAIQQLATLGRTATRYVTPLVSPGFRHQFSIQAVDAKGQVSDKVEFNPVIPQAKQAISTVPAPSSVTARETGSGEIRIDWSAVPGATAYFLSRSVAPGGFKTLCQLCPTETSYVDSGVTTGAKHIYTVAAITPFGTSRKVWSNEVTPTGAKVSGDNAAGETDGPPKGVTNSKATLQSPTSVEVVWGGGLGATTFRLYRRIGTGKEVLIATLGGTVTRFLDTFAGGFGSGVYYGIQAVNAKGSSAKATVAIAPGKAATDSAISTPSPKGPSGLKAGMLSPTSIQLTWVPGLLSHGQYQIVRFAGPGLKSRTVIAQIAGVISSFVDHLPPDIRDQIGYVIEAVDGKSASNQALVTLDPSRIDPAKERSDSASLLPKAPSDLKAQVVGPGTVRLSWNLTAISPVMTVVRIYRRLADGAMVLIGSVDPKVFSFLDHLGTGALAGRVTYAIESVNGKGPSKQVAVTIDPEKAPTGAERGTPEAITDLQATVVSPASIQLAFNVGPRATTIRIFRRMALGPFDLVATIGADRTSYLDRLSAEIVRNGVSYAVEAGNDQGTSERATVSVSPQKETVADSSLPPKAPSNPKATRSLLLQIELTWDAVAGATYEISRAIGAGAFQVLMAGLGPTVTRFVDQLPPGLRAATSVRYGITAITPKGRSPQVIIEVGPYKEGVDSSKNVSSNVPLKEPSGLKATVVSPTMVRLTWSPGVVGAMYRVMREASGSTQVIATLPGSVSNFLDHFPPGAVPGMIGYWIEAVDGKGASEKITVTMDPDKGPGEGEIDSLSRPRGRP